MNIFTAVKYCCILHGRVCVMRHKYFELTTPDNRESQMYDRQTNKQANIQTCYSLKVKWHIKVLQTYTCFHMVVEVTIYKTTQYNIHCGCGISVCVGGGGGGRANDIKG